jgi:hypothetical protein
MSGLSHLLREMKGAGLALPPRPCTITVERITGVVTTCFTWAVDAAEAKGRAVRDCALRGEDIRLIKSFKVIWS